MKKVNLKIFGIAVLMFLIIPLAAQATTQSWSTTAFTSMAHGTDYTWNVDPGSGSWSIPVGEHIVSASLTITELNNWYEPEEDYMNIFLLDDNTYNNTNNGWPVKTLLTTYRDTNGTQYSNPTETYTYDLTNSQLSVLTGYLSNSSNFALGFDPNCHYYDRNMTFTINTQVPEPSSLLLIGSGLLGLLAFRKKLMA
jgi:hypothetical protein